MQYNFSMCLCADTKINTTIIKNDFHALQRRKKLIYFKIF